MARYGIGHWGSRWRAIFHWNSVNVLYDLYGKNWEENEFIAMLLSRAFFALYLLSLIS